MPSYLELILVPYQSHFLQAIAMIKRDVGKVEGRIFQFQLSITRYLYEAHQNTCANNNYTNHDPRLHETIQLRPTPTLPSKTAPASKAPRPTTPNIPPSELTRLAAPVYGRPVTVGAG